MYKIISLCCLVITIFTACKHHEAPIPCVKVEKPFLTILEKNFVYGLGTENQYYNVATDTVLERNPIDRQVLLLAPKGYQSYEWKIGNNDSFLSDKNESDITSPATLLGNIPIRLIVRCQENACFPNGLGIDTVYKTLTVVKNNQNKLIGKYAGKTIFLGERIITPTTAKDTFTVENKTIYITNKPAPTTVYGEPFVAIDSLYKDIGLKGIRIRWGYKSFSISTNDFNQTPSIYYLGYGKLSVKQDSISFDYRASPAAYPDYPNQYPWYRFVGKRVPY